MSNQIFKAYGPLVQLVSDNADGAHTYGAIINLKQNTEVEIRADLTALTGTPAGPDGVPAAVPGAKGLWNAAKATKVTATANYNSAQSAGRALASMCINTLKPVLGAQWGSGWNAAGFTSGSLAVPTNPFAVLQQLRTYYENNPAREVADVNGVACTAVACEAEAKLVSAAESASNQSNSEAITAHTNFQTALTNVSNRASGLLTELTQVLEPNDPRWLAFGFEMPGHPSGPDVPVNVTATAGGPGSRMIFVQWPEARRADGYRVTVSDPVTLVVLAELLTQDAEVSVPGLTSGDKVSLTVSARNATGESQPSVAISIVVP